MKKVELQDTIVIEKSAEEVFAFVSDGNNDPLWRSEVDEMDVQGDIAAGTLLMEYSSFFKFMHTVTPTYITEFEAPKRIIMETPGDQVWLRSTRQVESLGSNQSKFIYELAFDLELTRQMLPITLPVKLVARSYSRRIRRYLNTAKQLIEAQ